MFVLSVSKFSLLSTTAERNNIDCYHTNINLIWLYAFWHPNIPSMAAPRQVWNPWMISIFNDLRRKMELEWDNRIMQGTLPKWSHLWWSEHYLLNIEHYYINIFTCDAFIYKFNLNFNIPLYYTRVSPSLCLGFIPRRQKIRENASHLFDLHDQTNPTVYHMYRLVESPERSLVSKLKKILLLT